MPGWDGRIGCVLCPRNPGTIERRGGDMTREQRTDFYGRAARLVGSAKAIRPLFCVIATSLSMISFPAWSDCNQPDRTPASRYIVKGAEVYDTQTHLTWARCSVGQVWMEGSGCVGTIRTLTFEQAKQQVNSVWRLPTGNELLTLVARCQRPAINTEIFPNVNVPPFTPFYWSDAESHSDFAGIVDFDLGTTWVLKRTLEADVRLVRRK